MQMAVDGGGGEKNDRRKELNHDDLLAVFIAFGGVTVDQSLIIRTSRLSRLPIIFLFELFSWSVWGTLHAAECY